MKMKNRVLAVLALALLMINMLPVKVAEAAEVPSYMLRYTEDIKAKRNVDIPYYAYITLMVKETASGQFNFVNQLFLIESYSPDIDIYVSNNVVHLISNYINDENGVREYIHADLPFDSVCTRVFYYFDGNMNLPQNINLGAGFEVYDLRPEPEPVVLPVTEPSYEYWLYHKTTSGEYMYWSKDPFDLESSEGKYILNLSTGDIMYRLHLASSHKYYRQILSGSMQYVISPGDIFRSGQDLAFDGITINAWTTGDVTSEEDEEPQYNIPHITKFLTRVRSARSLAGKPREYSMSIDLALSGDFDDAVTEQKVLIDGNYILPSEAYFRFCDSENIEPSTSHFMKFVKNKQEEYYIFVNWSHIESIVNLSGLTSDYGFRLTYSNAVDVLIQRGEFDSLYSKSVQAAYDNDIRKLCCPYRLACTLVGVVDDVYYYGDTFITVLYSEMDETTEDVSGVYSHFYDLDNDQKTDAIESTINAAQDDKLKEYIDKKDAELDALIKEYEMKLATLDTTLSSGGTGDLFGTFSSVANGLVGLSGSFRSIAIAVGNVFAFFPGEITGLLFAGIVAMIVIAVYKALRG